jgi:hypothetical protein
LAIAALRYLGKEQVDINVIKALKRVLSDQDFQILRQATTALPSWALDKFYEYEAGRER